MTDATAEMRKILIVREPFANYKRGDQIEESKLIKEISESEHIHFVNRVLLPEIQFEKQPEKPILKSSKKSKE